MFVHSNTLKYKLLFVRIIIFSFFFSFLLRRNFCGSKECSSRMKKRIPSCFLISNVKNATYDLNLNEILNFLNFDSEGVLLHEMIMSLAKTTVVKDMKNDIREKSYNFNRQNFNNKNILLYTRNVTISILCQINDSQYGLRLL